MKRRVILTAVIVLVVSLSTFTHAAPYGGSGTDENPYQIWTPHQMNSIGLNSGDWGKYFKLMDNIDMSIYTGTQYNLIGNATTPFTGTFDGNGHVISNLTYATTEDVNYVGLFGVISNATIQNLGLNNVSLSSGGNSVGGLVGYNNYGTLTACYATGTISGTQFIGGLVGMNFAGSITACHAADSVNALYADSYVGGLVGYNSGSLTACYATGSVNGANYTGGMAGGNYGGTISSCYATGSVNSIHDYAANTGGLVGNNEGTITSCYATGLVSGKNSAGGLVGNNNGIVISCYATGSVSGTAFVGGFVGKNLTGIITVCFWDMQTSGQAGSSGGKGLTTEQMKTMCIYQNAGWVDKGWVMIDGADYPHQSWENTGGVPIPSAIIPFAGSGTVNEPYLISTAQEFALLSWYSGVLDKQIKLTANLDLNGIKIYPIGDLGLFSGVFEGGGYTASHVLINQPGSTFVGLFARVALGGQIKNLGIENVNITGRDCVGGLAGQNDSSSTLINCFATGSVGGNSSVGGLVGYNHSGTLTDCYASVSVNGEKQDIGGLVGYNFLGTLNLCYANGSVYGTGDYSSNIGGLVGGNAGAVTSCYATGSVSGTGNHSTTIGGLVGGNAGAVTSCYATGLVSGGENSGNVGGLIGQNYSTTISTCYATGSVSGTYSIGGLVGQNFYSAISTCYAIGSVSGMSDIGGLVGNNSNNTITNCFWDIQTSGLLNGVGIGPSGGVTGKITAEMIFIWTFIVAGWDFSQSDGDPADWWMPDNKYPHLGWAVFYGGGSGTADDPYQIRTSQQMNNIGLHPEDWASHFILMADIDMSIFTGRQYHIIGTWDNPFVGTFDGAGHVIRNLTYTTSEAVDFVGLFGCTENAVIQNLGIENISFVSNGDVIGGLAGNNGGLIISCYTTGTISGAGYIGGLVGVNDSGSITSCYTTVSIGPTGYMVGGLVGANDSGLIRACYATGSVGGTGYIGGLVGGNGGSLTACYATGKVSGTGCIGGLAGGSDGTITACFWDIQSSGSNTGIGDSSSGGATGKTTAGMKTLSTFTPPWRWDFTTTDGDAAEWVMLREGEDYPRLEWQTVLAGDIAGLYGVDIVDFAELARNWLKQGCPSGCEQADMDNSGTVDLGDLAILMANWMKQ
jgi:hypothetical protein